MECALTLSKHGLHTRTRGAGADEDEDDDEDEASLEPCGASATRLDEQSEQNTLPRII